MEQKKFYMSFEISPELREWIKQRADEEKRSMSAQVIWELEQLMKGGK